jgi:hypothetical protein
MFDFNAKTEGDAMQFVLNRSSGRKRTAVLDDPYLQWSRMTNFEGHGAVAGDASIPVRVLLELAGRGSLVDLAEREQWLQVPGISRTALFKDSRFGTAFVPLSRLDDLQALVPKTIARYEFALPLRSGDTDPFVPVARPPRPGRLVVGVIDRDLAFLHTAFRRRRAGEGRGSTRIVAFWDQATSARGARWRRPEGFGYGRELDQWAIDDLIALADRQGEEAVYRSLGCMVGPDGRLSKTAHGTFVLDVAAGLPEAEPWPGDAKPVRPDAACEADLIFVSLPDLGAKDTTGASPGAHLLDGVRYILDRAGEGARVVINLSVGIQAGPHDGSSLFEQALDELLESRPDVKTVVAAGNGAKARTSATGLVECATVGGLVWQIRPQDVTDSFLELWLRSADAKTGVQIRLIPPGVSLKPDEGWVAPGECGVWCAQTDGPPLAGVDFREKRPRRPKSDAMALLCVAPTLRSLSSAGHWRPTAPYGGWAIEVRAREGAVAVDAWVQSDEPPIGFSQPLQSFFAEATGALKIDAGNTLNGIATGTKPVVAGACDLASLKTTSYSSREEGSGAGRSTGAVSFFAPADETSGAAGAGLWAAGVRSDTRVRLSGTSVSAPVVTRHLINTRAGAVAAGLSGSVPFVIGINPKRG